MSRLGTYVRHIQQHLHRQLTLNEGVKIVGRRKVTVFRVLSHLQRKESSSGVAEIGQLPVVDLGKLHIWRTRQEVRCVADNGCCYTLVKHTAACSEHGFLIHRIRQTEAWSPLKSAIVNE